MFSENETVDSEDYDDPNYWFQMGEKKARDLNSNFGTTKILESEDVENFDDVDLNYWFKMGDGNVHKSIGESEDVGVQNQNPEDYQILDEPLIHTSEDVTDLEDVPPPEDHTYNRPDDRGARIQMTVDHVVRQNRFRRRRRDVQNPPPPKPILYHLTRGSIPYTRKIPEKPLRAMEMARWTFLKIQNPLIRPLDFHRFSNVQLCHFACRNSPSGMVTTNCVVSFVLHHFPYYRFDRTFTMDRVRTALRRGTIFDSFTVAGMNRTMYSPLDPEKFDITEEQFLAMDMDQRGRDFFDRMLNGELGLPRQLFYHVIASPCPQLAGPENSALFYHLLSLGHIPPKCSAQFRMHLEPCLAVEPRFDEMQAIYPSSRSVKEVEKLKFFGVNGMETVVVDPEYSDRFFASIFAYFANQNFWKSSGMKDWETPSFPI